MRERALAELKTVSGGTSKTLSDGGITVDDFVDWTPPSDGPGDAGGLDAVGTEAATAINRRASLSINRNRQPQLGLASGEGTNRP